MTPTKFVEERIDLCASIPAVKDYEYDVRDNIVVRARIELLVCEERELRC